MLWNLLIICFRNWEKGTKNCSETALKLLWNCSETALKWPGIILNFYEKITENCSEIAPKLLWKCSESALKVLWKCCGIAGGIGCRPAVSLTSCSAMRRWCWRCDDICAFIWQMVAMVTAWGSSLPAVVSTRSLPNLSISIEFLPIFLQEHRKDARWLHCRLVFISIRLILNGENGSDQWIAHFFDWLIEFFLQELCMEYYVKQSSAFRNRIPE